MAGTKKALQMATFFESPLINKKAFSFHFPLE